MQVPAGLQPGDIGPSVFVSTIIMGRDYIYVNFDARETGVRSGKFWEERIDPQGLLLRRLLHRNITKKASIPDEWLSKCSEDQRRTLGRFRNVPLEVINAILTHVTDYTSAACFGATHPLLVLPAFERMRDISCTLSGTSQWASDRITLIEKYLPNPALPPHVLTEDEKSEMADLAKADGEPSLWEEWPEAETNYAAPNHGDELRARTENVYYSFNADKADARWTRAYAKKPMKERRTSDYKRVLKFLKLVEEEPFIKIHAGQYALCNETKREYVTAKDVAQFLRRGLGREDVHVTGPFIASSSRWALGDTAGFLAMWDGDNDNGIGVGPWVGDRICVTTLRHMHTMKGTNGDDLQAWTHIGGKDSDLWKRINNAMGDGDPDWMKRY
ncbi:hypothetical protein PENSPDRAFT_732750 [Peniophora sp. CONT]|nr:hypothetical protein PENSPDRAFT_732750 [Peniophora sp. CONT]